MKNITKLFAIALVILGFTATLSAQVSATANASAKILAGLTLTKTIDLNFGTMTVPICTNNCNINACWQLYQTEVTLHY